MSFELTCIRCFSWLAAIVLTAAPTIAGPPSDTLLPRTTKGYISVARPTDFAYRWDKTQFGQLLNDELMQPFVEDVRKQLRDRYRAVEDKLGITWDDLEGVPAGELSFAILERQGQEAAVAITIDVTGHDEQAAKLLATIEQRFTARRGRKETATVDGITLSRFIVPASQGRQPQVTVYFIKDNVLVGVDDRAEAEAMLRRFSATSRDNLKAVAAYTATMERCRKEAGALEPEARWFVEPFGLVDAAKTLEKTRLRRIEQDVAKILRENGFDAIQGVGGYLNQLVDGHLEIVHRTAIYAPPVKGKDNDPLRWNLSMRMLQLPNAKMFEPQSWVPRMSASYTTIYLDLLAAFDNLGPVFDAFQGHEDAWANTVDAWKTDVYGNRVDVRKEFLGNMGQRVTIVTDYETPISIASERSVFAIEATNETALAETLEKWMTKEPDVQRREVGRHVVWERVPAQIAVNDPEIDAPGFTPLQEETSDREDDETKRDRVLPNSAVCVAFGNLMMASDIEYLRELLAGHGMNERLSSSADYRQVWDALNRLAPGPRSGWSFARTDEEFRPTYELVRQGKMPEAETMTGKFLNNMLTTEVEREEGILRKQRIDGSTLPSFEAVRRYFGPAGRVLRSDKDGWFVTGAILNKEAP